MNLNEYQSKIAAYDLFDKDDWSGELTDSSFMEKVLGLAGEAGEVADKFKKILRDDNAKLTKGSKAEIAKELGDTLWYIATVARYLDIPLDEIAEKNIQKLQSRLDRNKLSGSGDNR